MDDEFGLKDNKCSQRDYKEHNKKKLQIQKRPLKDLEIFLEKLYNLFNP